MQSIWVATSKSLLDLETIIRTKLYALTDTHITVTQAYVLRALLAEDGLMPSELAREVGRLATSFTPVLDGLEGQKLIARKASATDRRAIGIYLTVRGRSLAEAVTRVLSDAEAEYSK